MIMLILALVSMWCHAGSTLAARMSSGDRKALAQEFMPPTFQDPFGNFYFLQIPDSSAAFTPGLTMLGNLAVTTFNMDGTAARFIRINSDLEVVYHEIAPSTDLVIPCLFGALFTLFAFLWFLNARRNRLPQP